MAWSSCKGGNWVIGYWGKKNIIKKKHWAKDHKNSWWQKIILIFDPAEKAVFKKVTFSTGSLGNIALAFQAAIAISVIFWAKMLIPFSPPKKTMVLYFIQFAAILFHWTPKATIRQNYPFGILFDEFLSIISLKLIKYFYL